MTPPPGPEALGLGSRFTSIRGPDAHSRLEHGGSRPCLAGVCPGITSSFLHKDSIIKEEHNVLPSHTASRSCSAQQPRLGVSALDSGLPRCHRRFRMTWELGGGTSRDVWGGEVSPVGKQEQTLGGLRWGREDILQSNAGPLGGVGAWAKQGVVAGGNECSWFARKRVNQLWARPRSC